MVSVEFMLDRGLAFFLVMSRIAGIFMLSPLLAGAVVPIRVRMMLTAFLAAAVFAGLPSPWQTPPDLTLFGVAQMAVAELMVGAAIGMIASLPVVAAQVGGEVMGYQMGLALARAFDPLSQASSGALQSMLFYIAIGTFVAMGGLEGVFMAVYNTFGAIPLGGLGPSVMPVELVVGLLQSGYEAALRIAAPVIVMMLIETVATGVIMKTIPGVNILSIGFAIKIFLGMMVTVLALGAIAHVLEDELGVAIRHLLEAAGEPPAPPGGRVPGAVGVGGVGGGVDG